MEEKGRHNALRDEEKMGEVIIFEGTYEFVTKDDYEFEPKTREVQLYVECKCVHYHQFGCIQLMRHLVAETHPSFLLLQEKYNI